MSERPAADVLWRVADDDEVARQGAEEIARVAAESVSARGTFTIALTGGATPKRLYELLASPSAAYRTRVPWAHTHAFFGDERHVPPEHADSNYRMAREALLDHVELGSVHRMRGEEPDAEAAALAYEAELESFFGVRADRDAPPRFDLVLLGLGEDAHVASLFPGSAALDERRRWVVAPYAEHLGAHRITLTLPVLNAGREVLFLVSGARKAEAVAKVLAPAAGISEVPAARVRPASGKLVWLVDEAAASRVAAPHPGG
jgi:6-phosphogluconolactonase